MPDQSEEPDGDALHDALPGTYPMPFTPDGIMQGLDDLQKIFGVLPSHFDGVADVVQGLSEVRSLSCICRVAEDSLSPLQIHPIVKVAVVALSVPYKVNCDRRYLNYLPGDNRLI